MIILNLNLAMLLESYSDMLQGLNEQRFEDEEPALGS